MLAAVEGALGALEAAGIGHQMVIRTGSPYISCARAEMLRLALDTDAEAFVFLDHDVSFRPQDLVTLIKTEGDVVAGTYRFKQAEERYMGTLRSSPDNRPVVRVSDGAIRAEWVPAGFLRITREAVRRFMRAHPELLFGHPEKPSVDLFNHGAHEGLWWGEDYAFSRRWNALGEIWLVPNMQIDHHSADEVFPGNFHEFLMACPGGSNDRS